MVTIDMDVIVILFSRKIHKTESKFLYIFPHDLRFNTPRFLSFNNSILSQIESLEKIVSRMIRKTAVDVSHARLACIQVARDTTILDSTRSTVLANVVLDAGRDLAALRDLNAGMPAGRRTIVALFISCA